MRLLGCACAVLALTAISASPAWATFPGRDGLLAVQPVSGGGLIIVGARGQSERRICTDRALCGTPRSPRWSSDGRALAFDASTVHLIYPDGSCLNCQMGTAGTPSFTSNPTLVTFQSGGKLLEDGIDGIRKATILKAAASDAVWSAAGDLALVRGGQVWVGTPPHRLRRLGAGSAPSWSPSGAQIAIVRKGWVLVVGVRHHGARRLVRGSAPAWSPDGKSIAFIGPGHDLRVIPAGGGASHRVGNVRGDSVDWQPIPRKPLAACAAPPGATVMASSATAVVIGDSNADDTAAMGCLRADGEARLLERFSNGEDGATNVGPAAVGGGDYAAVANDGTDAHYGGEEDWIDVFNLSAGAAVPDRGGESVTCPAGGPCADVAINEVVVGSGGISAADLTAGYPPGSLSSPLRSVSCPSVSLCVAVDGAGHTFTSTQPILGQGAWASSVGESPTYISCPSTSLCVGVGAETIFASNPASDPGIWTAVDTDGGVGHSLTGISCPTVSLCVATDFAGDVITSTDPSGGPGAWSLANVDGTHPMGGVTCPSASLCVATDYFDQAITSTDPTGGSGAWQAYGAAPYPGLLTVACASPTLCFGVDFSGHVFTSADPADGIAWTPVNEPAEFAAMDCPSPSFCAAVGNNGTLQTSTDPASGQWTSTDVDGLNALASISCASASECVAGDDVGNLVASSDATGGPADWTATLVDGNACSEVTWCTTESIVSSDGTGVKPLDTLEFSGQGSMLTELALSGDTLTWDHAGTPASATLFP